MGNWRIKPLMKLADCFQGAEWENTVAAAGRENEWFTPGQIASAIDALRREMLTRESLTEWLSAYRFPDHWHPGRIGIVMAGNLPLVGFADLAAVVVTGHTPIVKPSSKDRPLMRFVVERLRDEGCVIEWVDRLPEQGLDGAIATGGNAARDHFARELAAIPTLLRGARQSVAVLTGDETNDELKGLASDLFLYWGLGCRSIVRLFVPTGYDLAPPTRRLAAHLPFSPAEATRYTQCYRYARAMAVMSGCRWHDGESFILRHVPIEEGPETPKIAEVLWSEYSDPAQVEEWLTTHETELQCAEGAVPPAFPRRVKLGQAQCPGWRDYADGIDTVDFLLRIGQH